MRGQAKFKQGKLAARRRRRAFYLCLYSAAAAGLLLSALSFISSLDALAVREVRVEGASRLSASAVEAVADADLAGTYGYFFPRSNVLLYPRSDIRRDVLALPPVKSAQVTRTSLGTVEVSVSEREAVALWCAGSRGDSSDCYALDDAGYVFDRQPPRPTASSSDFVYRGVLEGDPIGKNFLSPESFRRIRYFMTELAGLSVEPRQAELQASSTYMTVSLAQGGRLVVNAADDLSTVLGNVAAIISDKSIAPSLASFLASLDYMKLDVGNKVVYKLKSK